MNTQHNHSINEKLDWMSQWGPLALLDFLNNNQLIVVSASSAVSGTYFSDIKAWLQDKLSERFQFGINAWWLSALRNSHPYLNVAFDNPRRFLVNDVKMCLYLHSDLSERLCMHCFYLFYPFHVHWILF
jgi:hypothetical protein